MGAGYQVGVAFGFEVTVDGRACHAAMAGDVNFVISIHQISSKIQINIWEYKSIYFLAIYFSSKFFSTYFREFPHKTFFL